jgi:FAD/FMN-containing dehydrogenase
MSINDEIKKFFKGDVKSDQQTLAEYSRDASFFYISPQVVTFPKDVEDIKNLVNFVVKNKLTYPQLSLTARAAGTDMSGGSINESIIVEFNKYFNHVKEVGENFVISEPGVYYRDLEKETLKKNLYLPSFPASREICALGGMLANNSGGEQSLRYGKTKDYVEYLKVVLADGNEYQFQKINQNELSQKMSQKNFEGEIYRKVFNLINENLNEIQKAKPKVSKNSAGYNIFEVWDGQNFDLTKLFVGSQGTLGMITEAKLRLVPKVKHSRLLVIFLQDFNLLPQIIKKVLPSNPLSFEAYDNHTFSLAMKFLPEIIKKIGGNAFVLGFKFLPEIWMSLTGGLPRLVLIPEFVGDDLNDVLKQVQTVYETLKPLGVKMHITHTLQEADKYRIIRRESFNLLRQKIKDKQTAPFIDDLIVLPEKLPEFLPELYQILNQYPSLIYTVAGHIGDGNFHIIPLMNLNDPNQRKIIPELAERVFNLVLKYGGSITAEHNDGLIHGPYLRKMYGEKIFSIFQEIKNIFDPQNIFNPGKKVNANLNYALEHIRAK